MSGQRYGRPGKAPPFFGYPHSLHHTTRGEGVGPTRQDHHARATTPAPSWITPPRPAAPPPPKIDDHRGGGGCLLCILPMKCGKNNNFVAFTTHERNKIIILCRSSVKSAVCAFAITKDHPDRGVCVHLRLLLVGVRLAVPQFLLTEKHGFHGSASRPGR